MTDKNVIAIHNHPDNPTMNNMRLFKADPITGVSPIRMYLLRIFYAMAVLMLGIDVWIEIFTHQQSWQPLPAVAFSFWGGFSLLAILGIFHPLKMVPLLLLQFTYKLIWLIMVAYPLWRDGMLPGSGAEILTQANFIGLILDSLIIPWGYVANNFLSLKRKPV